MTDQKVKNQSARLLAVQAVYQASLNDQPLKSVADEYLSLRVNMEVDGETIVEPDGALFKRIVLGVADRKTDLGDVIKANFPGAGDKTEPLLRSICMCGAYELLANLEVDKPIIINDYLNVTHSFFEKNQVSLVNGVLDSVAKAVRD